jgi:flagellar basal body rod protein FlgG
MRPKTLVLPLCLLAAACNASRPSPRAARDPDLFAVPTAIDPDHDPDRQRIDALVLTSYDLPDTATRPSTPAAALATTDRRMAPLVAALGSIDRAVEVCATNLANAETTAYRARRAVSTRDGTPCFRTDCQQGSLANTGRQLDVGIAGDGFFKVKVSPSIAGGFAYTRNGNFFANRDGELVLGMGDCYPLASPIRIPKSATDISISQDGVIEVTVPGTSTKQRVGVIRLWRFVNAEDLNPLGGSLFAETAVSGPPTELHPGESGAGQVLQGFLESSNVDITRERLRIRFLQNWRNAILKAVDDAR